MVNYMPKVSIIMNCYNGEKYLREALDSIYAQTFTDWEIIFFDNNSSDSSGEIAQSYDERVMYHLNSETIPLGHARKEALALANGEWLAFLDVDDLWIRDKLELQLAAVCDSDYLLCYGGITEINEDGSKVCDEVPVYTSGNILEKLLYQYDINMVTPLVLKEALVAYDLNFDTVITASEEYNLFVRLAAKGPICVMNRVLGYYRLTSGSLTERNISKWAFERRYTLEQLEKENPGISEKYSKAFKEAWARGDYYEACYKMKLKKYSSARSLLKKNRSNSRLYYMLWLVSFFPYFWAVAHSNFIKRTVFNFLKK